MEYKMKLSELKNKERGIIVKVKGRGAFRKRITEMGFVKGKEVKVIKNAPLKDPVEYSILGYEISLRRSEASLIEVITPEEARDFSVVDYKAKVSEEILRISARERGKNINVALVGNPNSGKTTLFNHASRSKEHVGNYSGVTVDSKKATFKQSGYTFHITDLPGTYSLTAYSPEELYVRNYIFHELPDVVINVVDSSNLERNLYLTTQLIDMDVRVVLALNMYDELSTSGDELDTDKLAKLLGFPIVPTVSSKGEGISKLFEKVIEVYEDQSTVERHIHINYGNDVEENIKKIQSNIKIPENYFLTDKISSRFLAIKLLEKDKESWRIIDHSHNPIEIRKYAEKGIARIQDQFQEDSETIMTDAKYGFIAGALKETLKINKLNRYKTSDIIDAFITHKVWGFPIFLGFMWLMFQATFRLGAYPQKWIEYLVGWMQTLIAENMQAGMLKDLLINGILDGVGGVIVFLPNILILFFFISLMEDTGYMARVAFIMDKIMHKIGLHGKSFIPLLMGFGCNVPAIMATRTIESRNDRLVTMLINPLMSCSARLPVYVLIIGAFFANNAGTILFLIYFLGILLAAVVAIILKKFFFKSKDVPFVMELPPYRLPTLKATFRHMWNKGSQYLKKMGGVILVAAIIIWALGYFPRQPELEKKYKDKIESTMGCYNDKLTLIPAEKQQIRDSLKKIEEKKLKKIKAELSNTKQKNSYIGQLGKAIEPVITPLGFDWRMGVSIVSGIAAKEIVVSTLGVLYQAESSSTADLKEKLQNTRYSYGKRKGEKVFTPVVAISFIFFILIYFPCIAVIAAIKSESGSWKWALFTIVYTTSLAWLVSFITYQVGSFFVSYL